MENFFRVGTISVLVSIEDTSYGRFGNRTATTWLNDAVCSTFSSETRLGLLKQSQVKEK
jgi:hypothetical protein